MSVFTAAERAYLGEQRLGRLATVGRRGEPHVVPVGFRYDPERDVIAIGGRGFAGSKKYRDLRADPRCAFVVDDVAPGGRLRLLEVRGSAELVPSGGRALSAAFDEPMIRLRPRRIVAMGLDVDDREPRGRDV